MADFEWNIDEHLFLWTSAMPKIALVMEVVCGHNSGDDLGKIAMPELGLVMDYAVGQSNVAKPLRPMSQPLSSHIGAFCQLNPKLEMFMESVVY